MVFIHSITYYYTKLNFLPRKINLNYSKLKMEKELFESDV